jgi:hypothetical protein
MGYIQVAESLFMGCVYAPESGYIQVCSFSLSRLSSFSHLLFFPVSLTNQSFPSFDTEFSA